MLSFENTNLWHLPWLKSKHSSKSNNTTVKGNAAGGNVCHLTLNGDDAKRVSGAVPNEEALGDVALLSQPWSYRLCGLPGRKQEGRTLLISSLFLRFAQVQIKGGEWPGSCKHSFELQLCNLLLRLIKATKALFVLGAVQLQRFLPVLWNLQFNRQDRLTLNHAYNIQLLPICLSFHSQPVCLSFRFALVELHASLFLFLCNAINSVVSY